MGYTHYWKQKTVSTNYSDQASKVSIEIPILLELMPKYSSSAGGYYKEHPILLKSGDGTGEPEINKAFISFNGDGSKDLDHESFYYEFEPKPFEFSFCKTARKPYDLAVCLCLLSLANHIDTFEFSSDGGREDWETAIDIYTKYHRGEISENLSSLISNL